MNKIEFEYTDIDQNKIIVNSNIEEAINVAEDNAFDLHAIMIDATIGGVSGGIESIKKPQTTSIHPRRNDSDQSYQFDE